MRVDETYGVLLTLHDWQMAGLSYSLYEKDRQRGHLSTTGRACQGREVEIVYDKLRDDRKRVIDAVFGNTIERMSDQPALVEHIRPDAKARDFFNSYRPEGDASRYVKRIKEYTNDAILLNAMHDLYNERSAYRRACNGKAPSKEAFFLEQIAALGHPDIAESYPNTLPTSVRRLKNKYDTYLKEGYGSLISAKFANDNARKVTEKIERLLVALYSMPNKPFCSSVKDLYDMFLTGKITVFDKETGEVFQPEDFRRNGEPVELSESTIWNYLNQAVNRAVADKRRNDGLYYNNLHRPHHHRKSPQYSFSKISMDDRDLPRLLVGGGRVKAYYAYDVASGCVIGAAYSLKKDDKLFLDCLRDMFRLIDRNGFGIPMEVEVEHHLVNHFADTLMRAGVVFPFVRWCAAGNSQEKRAEHLNRAKKYGAEKQMQEQPIGRWYARHEAYRTPSKKVNDEYVERQYDYEVLVAEDLAAIREFNNSVHPRKKTYGGMTRWEVLKSHLNPELQPLGKASLYRYIGERTECSIARSQYVRVQYEKYQLSSPEVMRLLRPNDYNVTAYYMKEEDGDIPRVYLYQGDTFLCACEKIVAYNEARCEQTEADRAAMQEQAKYVARYDRLIKDRMPDRVGLLLPETLHADPDERELQVDIPEAEAKQARGMELVPDYSEEAMRQMALADI